MNGFILRTVAAIIVLSGVLGTSTTNATVTYDLGIPVNGDTPTGTPPWISAVITNSSLGGFTGVTLTMRTNWPSSDPNQKVDTWAFKLNTAVTGNPGSLGLGFSLVARNPSSIGTPSISVGNGNQNVPGAGNLLRGFDIQFDFPISNNDAFKGGGEISYFIFASSGYLLRENDFLAVNPTGYATGAHIIGINDSGSGAIAAVPIPEHTHAIFGALLLGGLLWVERGRIQSLFRTRRVAA